MILSSLPAISIQDAGKKALEALKADLPPGARRIDSAAAAVIVQAYDELGKCVHATPSGSDGTNSNPVEETYLTAGPHRGSRPEWRAETGFSQNCLAADRVRDLRSVFLEAFGSLPAAPVDSMELWCDQPSKLQWMLCRR